MTVAFTGFAHPAAADTGWQVVATPQPGTKHASGLDSVVALSSSNVWAGGDYAKGFGVPLLLHWTGRNWHRVSLPTAPAGQNTATVVAGPSGVWVGVGAPGTPYTMLLHHNGTSWRRFAPISRLPTGFMAFAAAMTGPDNLWLGGDDSDVSKDPILYHWNGATWTMTELPLPPTRPDYGYVTGLTFAPGATRPTAVGAYAWNCCFFHPYTARFTSTGWQYQAAPSITGRFDSVMMLSKTDGWAVGSQASGVLIRHWNGTSWTATSPGRDRHGSNALTSVSASSRNNGWAVGFSQACSKCGRRTLAEHWDGSRWTIVATVNPSRPGTDVFTSVAAVPGSTQTWAVGYRGPEWAAKYNVAERTN